MWKNLIICIKKYREMRDLKITELERWIRYSEKSNLSYKKVIWKPSKRTEWEVWILIIKWGSQGGRVVRTWNSIPANRARLPPPGKIPQKKEKYILEKDQKPPSVPLMTSELQGVLEKMKKKFANEGLPWLRGHKHLT